MNYVIWSLLRFFTLRKHAIHKFTYMQTSQEIEIAHHIIYTVNYDMNVRPTRFNALAKKIDSAFLCVLNATSPHTHLHVPTHRENSI